MKTETDMCEAFQQNRLEGLNEGIALGKAEGLEFGRQEMYVLDCQEFNCTYEETLKRFQNKFHTSKAKTKEIVDRYWMVH